MNASARARWRGAPVVGVDLGTSASRVYLRGRGLTQAVPSAVALDRADGRVRAVGDAALQLVGRASGGWEVRLPLRHGVVVDVEAATALLRHLLRSVVRVPLLGAPRAVVCAPADITDIERRAVADATLRAGARSVAIIEEPMAAAIGAGLPVADSLASMVVDMGGGTTEAAVIALGGIVTRTSVRVGGDDLDEAIAAHLRRGHRLDVGPRTAERLKRALAGAHPGARRGVVEVAGQDLARRLPAVATVSAEEIAAAVAEPLAAVVACVRRALERTPPELVADMMDRGLTLTGGGALLPGLDRVLADAGNLPVRLAPRPLLSVAIGAGRCLEHIDVLDHALAASHSAGGR
jgi:rod shape-determining protein MreB and related proteins